MTDNDGSLVILGTVSPEEDVVLVPSFTSKLVDTSDTEDSEYAVQFEQPTGEQVAYALSAASICIEGNPRRYELIAGRVPRVTDAQLMRIVRSDRVLFEQSLPLSAPTIEPLGPVSTDTDPVTLSWTASHPENVQLSYIVLYDHTNTGTWQPISLPTTSTTYQVPLETMPGGEACRFAVACSDGLHTVEATTPPFSHELRPCWCIISSPRDGETIQSGQPAILCGQGYWIEEDEPELEELRWTSSLDGDLGSGNLLSVELQPGLHQISLRAGRAPRESQVTVRLSVLD